MYTIHRHELKDCFFIYFEELLSHIFGKFLNFCSEVNTAGYYKIERPIRLGKKHSSHARYMLIWLTGRNI